MGKTAAESQQASRTRLKLRQSELLEYRKKDTERKKEKRLIMNNKELKGFRNRGKLATRQR